MGAVLPLLLIALAAGQPAGWRAGAEAFGETARIEVRGLETGAAESLLRAAVGELAAAEREAAALVTRVNAAAGRGPAPVAAAELELLARALSFCRWSQAAHGPLGGPLYDLWQGSLPPPASLRAATAAAACDNLELDREAGTAELAAGSRLDLRGFAPGWAVDRAVELLAARGAGNASVRLGLLHRAIGPGPSGRGWPAELDLPAEWIEPLGPIRLRDRALAVASFEPPLVIGGERLARQLNQRSGRPAAGTVATIALSELAVDAQALATTLFVLDQREGMLRLGVLRPAPAVAWLLGSGEAPPLVSTHRWRPPAGH